jgi:hypothetical protein
MPKRTNDFQRLIYIIKQFLADDAEVAESKLLRDVVTGTEREVDVCIEKPFGGHLVTISIECRDRGRPADVTWVEEMKAKHERLPTNVLALVSSSGFSPEALEVAKLYKIETISLEKVSTSVASQIVGKLSSLWCRAVVLSPTQCSVSLEPVKDLPAETIRALPDNAVYAEDGSELGVLLQYVQLWLRSPEVMGQLLDLGTEAHEWFEFGVESPFAEGVTGKRRVYLRKEKPRILRAIDSVKVIGRCRFTVSEFPLQHGALNDMQVAWGSGVVADQDSFLVVAEQADTKPQFFLTPKP